MPTFWSCGFVVDITLGSKDNQEEKTREGVDIRMYQFSLNFLQLGCDMLWKHWLTVLTLSAHLKTLSACELMVVDTVDGKDNKEKKIRGGR